MPRKFLLKKWRNGFFLATRVFSWHKVFFSCNEKNVLVPRKKWFVTYQEEFTVHQKKNPESVALVYSKFDRPYSNMIPPLKNQSRIQMRVSKIDQMNAIIKKKKRSTGFLIQCSWSIFETYTFTCLIFKARPFTWYVFHWRDRIIDDAKIYAFQNRSSIFF